MLGSSMLSSSPDMGAHCPPALKVCAYLCPYHIRIETNDVYDFVVARMMYLLEPSSQESAISLATALDAELEKVDLQVNMFKYYFVFRFYINNVYIRL